MLLFLRVIVVPLNMTALNSAEMLAVIIKCVDFAAIKHMYQRRKDPEKTPYINHPIGVAKILMEKQMYMMWT